MEQISSKYVGNGRKKETNRIQNGDLLVGNAKPVSFERLRFSLKRSWKFFPPLFYQHQILHAALLSSLLKVFVSVSEAFFCAKVYRTNKIQTPASRLFSVPAVVANSTGVWGWVSPDCNLRNKFKTILTLNFSCSYSNTCTMFVYFH